LRWVRITRSLGVQAVTPSTSLVRGWTPGDHGRRMPRARLPVDQSAGYVASLRVIAFSIATGSIINQRFAGERDAHPRERRSQSLHRNPTFLRHVGNVSGAARG